MGPRRLLAIAGALAGLAAALAAPPALAEEEGPPFASYLHDVSEPDPALSLGTAIEEHHRIPLAGGVELDAWTLRPPVPERVPLVLEVTPYYGGGPLSDVNLALIYPQAGNLVPRRYAFGVVSVRGTGASGGCFTIAGPEEARDTAAAIEYLAHRSWANGSVGLTGVSYPGTTPQDVWVEAPPSLRTIVPVAGISDLYKYSFLNGIPRVPQGQAFNQYYWGLTGLAPVGQNGGSLAADPVSVPGAIAGEACADQVAVQEGGASSALDGNKDAYWRARDFRAELLASWDRPRASVFYVHGLGDWNVMPDMMDGWLPLIRAQGVPFKAWLGQWAHAWPLRSDWDTVVAAWFDRFLKERETGILDGPAIQVQDDTYTWRHEDVWPLPTEWRTLYPDALGTLGAAPGGGVRTFVVGPIVGPAGSFVEFATEPLPADLRLTGNPRIEIDVTANTPRASIAFSLVDRSAIRDRPINYAALSLNHAASLEQGAPSIAGIRQRIALDFFPQDDVVREGHRLVLVAAGDVLGGGPAIEPLTYGATITVHLTGAVLRLPVDATILTEPAP